MAANPSWSGYNRTSIGASDVGCSFVPFAQNTRDMCVWFYNGEQPPALRAEMATQDM